MKFTFPPESRPLPGYTIKRAIDRGGFGEVYYALSDAGKEVALKLLQHNLDVELRGVRQCLNLRHPHLVTIFDIRTDDDEDHWIVMEYAGGRTLEQTLAAAQQPLTPAEALGWMRGIADGVEFLHARGLVHRDLKPGNIFADQGTVKVGDVGLSKFITPSRRSAQTESVGTVHYMAPEVARGRYGKEVDVYAAGVMLYEMLVGKVPFEGESTAEILMKHLTATPDLSPVPAPLRPLLARALEKDPERRLGSLTDLTRGLEQFVAGKQHTVPEARRETIQESIERKQTDPDRQRHQQPSPQPVMAAADALDSGDELVHFWRNVSRFFRPERLYLRETGRSLYRFWRQEVPLWIRWPLLLLSPLWFILLIFTTPWLSFVILVYYGVREAVRVAIWMADPPPGTHPWTRLFGGKPSSSSVTHQPQPVQYQAPPVAPFVPEAPSASYAFQQAPIEQPAFNQPPFPSTPQLPRRTLGFIERWLGLPLLGNAGFAAFLMIEATNEEELIPLFLLASLVIFFLLRTVTSRLLDYRAIPHHCRLGINSLLLSLAGFTAILGFAGFELLFDSAPRFSLVDEGWVSVVLAINGAIASLVLIGRRLLMTSPSPFPPAPAISQPLPQLAPATSSFPFGRALLVTFFFLIALSVCSILLAIVGFSPQRTAFPAARVVSGTGRLSVGTILVPIALAGIAFFLLRGIRLDRPPAPADAPHRTAPDQPVPRKRRSSEFWLVAGFLALWFSLALGWWKGFAPAAVDGSWASLFFYPNSWTGIALIVWGEILLLSLLVSWLVPKIPLQSDTTSTPRLAHLRLTTGFLQSLLWSLLLSAGSALTILALAETTSSRWSPAPPWELMRDSYTHLVGVFSFLALSSMLLFTQAYCLSRYGFFASSRFFTLLLSGLLIAGIKTGLDLFLGPIIPDHYSFSGSPSFDTLFSSLQFFLPTLICGGWLGQIDPARTRRFRVTRLLWVILVSAAVAGILEHDPIEIWIFLMAGLSCVVQLASLWTDPEGLAQRPAAAQSDPHYYNVSLVQGA